MSAQWTNKYAIMRDLSMVQGCVPVDVKGTIAAGEKPPAYDVVEETEEEFYGGYCTGDGDFDTPDVSIITQMLDMVRDIDVTSDSEDNTEKPKKVRQSRPESAPVLTPFSYKKKQLNKTVATGSKNPNCAQEMNHTDDVEKPTIIKQNNQFVPLLSRFSFKRKDSSQKVTKTVTEPAKISSCNQDIGNYVPSAQAGEYYKIFLERSQMIEDFQKDIWKKLEPKLQEVDARRERERERAEMFAQLPGSAEWEPVGAARLTTLVQSQKLDVVRLPQYRHLLTGQCAVCKVMLKRDYNIKAKRCIPCYCPVDPFDVDDDYGISSLFDISC